MRNFIVYINADHIKIFYAIPSINHFSEKQTLSESLE